MEYICISKRCHNTYYKVGRHELFAAREQPFLRW